MQFSKPFYQWLLSVVFLMSLSVVNAQTTNNLSYFIKTAQVNSPVLNDYNNQVLSNRIDSLKLRAAYGFIVTGEGNASYAPSVMGWGYDKALSNGQSLFGGIRIAKELVSHNNLKTRLDNYKANIAQLSAQKDIANTILSKQITDQYIATYTGQQLYKLSKEIISLLKQEDEVLKKLTQKAAFKQTDYLAFKVTLQQNELTLQQQTADWQNNYILLNYLSGIVDTTVQELNPPDIDVRLLPVSFEESIYTKSFRADSTKIVNDAKIIEYNYKPKITAFSDGGFQSSFTQTPYKNIGVSVGIAVSLPIYDGHQKQMLLQQNQLTMKTRQQYLSQTKRQYQQQIFQIKSRIEQYNKMIETANEQMEYASTLVEANAKQLPTGDVKMVDFILSISNLLNLKAGIIQYNNTLFSLKNQLKYLIIQ